MPIKDREELRELADGVWIGYRRSSAHPVAYAITLQIASGGSMRTMHLFDNSHGVEEHHEHRYVGDVKQPPTIMSGPVNTAMAHAIRVLKRHWPEIVRAWKETQ